MEQKTLYLWDLAGTLFNERWNSEQSGFSSYDDWVAHTLKRKLTDISPREYESVARVPQEKGILFKLSLKPGFREVLTWSTCNEAFTSGVPEQLQWRAHYLNPRVGFDITSFFQKVNTTFDFGETNQKSVQIFGALLRQKYHEGFRAVVYTDDSHRNCEFFLQAAEQLHKEHDDFVFRIYHFREGGSIQVKDWYTEVGSLWDIKVLEGK